MKKMLLGIVIGILISASVVTIYCLVQGNRKNEDIHSSNSSNKGLGNMEAGQSPILIKATSISNDISNLDLKVNFLIDLYVVSDIITDKSINSPLVTNVRIIDYQDKDFNSIDSNSENLAYLLLSVPNDVRTELNAINFVPTESIVVKKAENPNTLPKINQELKKLICDNYCVQE